MTAKLRLGRRNAMALGSAFCVSQARAATRPDVMIVAGPSGGQLDEWAGALALPLSRGLPTHPTIDRHNIGGIDGVTGANQFDARGEPDGHTALLLPGLAPLAWLAGEARARFDPARWIPLWASSGTAVLMSRKALSPGARLRVAAQSPVGPELPILLGLDLLGMDALPCPTATADSILVHGPAAAAAIAQARADGFQPLLTLGGGTGSEAARDPAFPLTPTIFELIAGRAPPELEAALRATALAVRLDAGLVLPALTPSASVALWRRACDGLGQDAEVAREAQRRGARMAAASRSFISDMGATAETMLALRRWLAIRYEWRPG